MGSTADLKYSKNIEKLAEEVGYWIAKNKATLVFGAEKDFDSLSTSACRGAKKAGGRKARRPVLVPAQGRKDRATACRTPRRCARPR